MTLDAIDMFLKIEGGDFSFIRMLSVILESIHTYFLFLFGHNFKFEIATIFRGLLKIPAT